MSITNTFLGPRPPFLMTQLAPRLQPVIKSFPQDLGKARLDFLLHLYPY